MDQAFHEESRGQGAEAHGRVVVNERVEVRVVGVVVDPLGVVVEVPHGYRDSQKDAKDYV